MHGYPNTPRGYPRLTHGFHEYPAGMQAAAASKALEALPGRALLDPFAGGGTTLVVGMADGRATKGVDVSPLACAVAAHRAWRPSGGDAATVSTMWMIVGGAGSTTRAFVSSARRLERDARG